MALDEVKCAEALLKTDLEDAPDSGWLLVLVLVVVLPVGGDEPRRARVRRQKLS